jgi:hypothetical protein
LTQVREIKCPHCREWTMWNGHVDDRCLFCGEFLEPNRFSREVEKKINIELLKEDDYLFVKPGDNLFMRLCKRVFNTLRWWAYYMQIAFFLFVTFLLVLISLVAV